MDVRQELITLRFVSEMFFIDLTQDVVQKILQKFAVIDDEVFWISLAVREAVINAIKHGNHHDAAKDVTVEFALVPNGQPHELVIRVTDEGLGFEPGEVGDPLAPENILKSSGRGIFFMRSFMDDVVLSRRPEGGMEVRMTKRLPATPAAFVRAS